MADVKTYFVVSHEMERPHVSTLHVVKTDDFEGLRRTLNQSAWIYHNVFTAEAAFTQYNTSMGGTELRRVMFIQPTMWARTILTGLVHELRVKNTTPEQWEALMEWVVETFSNGAAMTKGEVMIHDGTTAPKSSRMADV